MKHSKPSCIIGIGSSAGGVEALKELFRHIPADSGAAFVLLQHLNPSQESLMPQILSRITKMSVSAAEDKVPLEPNHVYVIPSHLVMTYKDFRLEATDPVVKRDSYTPIDSLFNALAHELGESAIGVILSGTGSDGTVGLRSIKGCGGVTIVQRPDTAKFDSMPRSALLQDVVDFELTLEEIAGKIGHFCAHLQAFRKNSASVSSSARFEEEVGEPLKRILDILKRRIQHDFQQYKKSTIIRRIQRRMHVHQVHSFEEYAKYIEEDEYEAGELFKDMLIGVTQFNRDPNAWQALADSVIPEIIKQAAVQPEHLQAIRVWVPGCSTGEEAYTAAMVIRECMDKIGDTREVKIFATDIDPRSLEIARRGIYPEGIAGDLSPERLERFFIKEKYLFRVKKEIRDMCVFSVHNVINNPPFSRVNLICCRNLMIYFEQGLQKKILPIFHYALISGGYLFVGMSENVSACSDLFRTVDKNFRIFQSKEVLSRKNLEFPVAQYGYPFAKIEQHLKENPYGQQKDVKPAPTDIFDRIILDKYTAASCVVNEKGDIVYTVGPVNKFLKIPPGEPKMNIITMARESIRLSLRTALHAAIKSHEMIEKDVQSAKDGMRAKVTVRPLPEAGDHTDFFLVVFQDIERSQDFISEPSRHEHRKEDQEMIEHLEAELSSTREYLEATIEKLETANEELKSSNEELLSMNEELQSSNEELQTSKEELHSMNEELHTVNADASRRVEELDSANSNLQNLYASTQIATLFLDNNLRIRDFTPYLQDIFNVIGTDVGRPIADISTRLANGDLTAEARSVLRTLERRVVEVKKSDADQWFMMQITPYRTVNNKIDGVTVSFFNITDQKKAQEEIGALNRDLQERLREMETVFDLVPVGLAISYHSDGRDIRMNQTGQKILGVENSEALFRNNGESGFYINEEKISIRDLPLFRALTGQEASTESLRCVRRNGTTVYLQMTAMPLFAENGYVRGVIGAFADITSLRTVQMELSQLNENLEQKVEERSREAHQRAVQLRRLAAQLFRVEQEERRKLSMILHDHLQQLLVSAKMRLRFLEPGEKMREVDGILDQAIHSAKSLTVQLRPPIDFSQGLKFAFEWLTRWAKKELHLDVRLELEGEDLICPEDFGYFLFQSARELLFNVSKHAGVNEARITLHCCREGRLLLEVADSGRGIGRDSGKHPEKGFGLFSLKERVDIIGGTCAIHSEDGKGTAVTLSFPEALARRSKESEQNRKQPAAELYETAYADAGNIIGRVKILIVDDHQVVREGFSTLIADQKNMLVVGQAKNGQEAIELAERLRPHVVLMDITLPDINGVEVTRRIKQRFPHMHVIGLSMHETESMAQTMKEAGASGYVTKADVSEKLIEAVNACTLAENGEH